MIIALAGCVVSDSDELQLQYDPDLVGDTISVGHATLQAPAGWQPMSDSLKQQSFGAGDLIIYLRPDNKAMMHVLFTQGNPEQRAEELKKSLSAQPSDRFEDNSFRFKGLRFRQFIMEQGSAITYMLVVSGSSQGDCELTYTLDKTIFQEEIRKVESSIASILLQ